MANDTNSRSRRSKGKPPSHIESYLTAKNNAYCPPFKIKARKYYCVVYGNLLQCFDNERSYTEKRDNVKAQIDLDMVCSISETVSLPARRQKHGFCFKIVFNDESEVDFAAQSKQEVKEWVDCLKETKQFWDNARKKENQDKEQFVIVNADDCNVKETKEDSSCLDNHDEKIDPSLIKVSIIMSHGQPYMAYVPIDGGMDDLWAATLKWLPGHFCHKCNTCQLRRSTMELWSVTKDGIAYRIEKYFSAAEYIATENPIYLLEHNFKLLVVFFEDSTFLVTPADISTKAREIPNIELFSRKLSEIECNDVQLYLRTATGTVTPFSLEDAPLRTLWEQHGDQWALKVREGEKFLLKSKVILRNNPERVAEKIQRSKIKTRINERKQKEALRQIEIHDCKPKFTKILMPLSQATKPLPFDPSLTSSSDMNENHFTVEPEVKSENPLQHCMFLPSPEKTDIRQLNAPFCPPDYLDFDAMPSQANGEKKDLEGEEVTVRRQRSVTDVTQYKTGTQAIGNKKDSESEEVTVRRQRSVTDVTQYKTRTQAIGYKKDSESEEVTARRQRSMTDVTQYETGTSTEARKLRSRTAGDSGSLSRKGAIRRKSSYDSLESVLIKTKRKEKAMAEQGLTKSNASHQSRDGLSRDSDQEKVPHKSTAVQNPQKAHSTWLSDEEDTKVLDQDDKTNDNVSVDGACVTLPHRYNRQHSNSTTYEVVHSSADETVCNQRKTNKHILDNFSGYDASAINSIDNVVDKEPHLSEGTEKFPWVKGRKVHRHSCDFYVVESPYFLKNILDQYSRLSVNEEEVGDDVPPRGICLSSHHLTNIQGCWVVENNVELDEEDNERPDVEDCEVFRLSGNIKVAFNRKKRTWDLKRIKEKENLEEKIPVSETDSDSDFSVSSIEELANGNVPVDQPANEDTGSNKEKREEESYRSTWKGAFLPLTINNCGQRFETIDDSFELDNTQTTDSPKTKLPSLSQDFTEIKILENAIQKLFYHMEKNQCARADECLDDVKYPEVRRIVCVNFCSALSSILSNGIKRKRTLLSAIRYTTWEVIRGTSNDVTNGIVKKISSLGPLDDKICFELFVCECMNQGTGALISWFESLLNDRKKLKSFYEDTSLVMNLSKDTLERLLSRITFLPFHITFFHHVQKRMKDERQIFQFTFE